MTPNARDSDVKEKMLIPRPSACGAKDLAEFEFLGRLVGLALRTGATLPLNMPPVVWKRLVRSLGAAPPRVSSSRAPVGAPPHHFHLYLARCPPSPPPRSFQVGQRMRMSDLADIDARLLPRLARVMAPSSEVEWDALQSNPAERVVW